MDCRKTGNEKWQQSRKFIFIFPFPVTSVYSYSTCMYVYMFEKDCKFIMPAYFRNVRYY